MGKSKHESFSSIDKSNFQLLKEKFRENSFKKHSEGKRKEGEKPGEDRENEEKEKKRSWRKLLSYVRAPWSCQGAHSNYKQRRELTITNSLKTGHDLKLISNPNRTIDVIEIPNEPGEKISEILIKPTKTGIKAAVAQYCGLPLHSEKSAGNKMSLSKDFSYEMKELGRNEEKSSEEQGKTNGKRLTWNAKVFENKKDNESLLTSALFIHQDMDKIVESTVFIEPDLPRDYADSKRFDEISQKSLKTNKRDPSYKTGTKLDGKKGQILKTFKTVSEPTWNERKKILQQQRLQDNINNLLEQFMLLEAEDVIDFPLSQNHLIESKKNIEFSQYSGLNSKEPLIKVLSREVSPKILVNIKPFKEHVSDDYINFRGSSTGPIRENHAFSSEQDHVTKKNKTEMPEKSKNIFNDDKISEETIFPLLKRGVIVTEKSDFERSEESSRKVPERTPSLSAIEKEIENTCYENFTKQISDFLSVQSNDDFKPLTPCTVWGLYKSYSACTSLTDEKQDEQKQTKEKQQIKKSLDEVLDNLDDSDHDVIFQKNISQFRRKINVVPRFDVKKAAIYSGKMGMAKKELKKNDTVKLEKPDINGVADVKEVSLKTSNGKQLRAFRFDELDLCVHGQKREKILQNIFLQLSETKLIFRPRIEATRIEAKTISFPQTLREVHDMLESNNFAIVEVEIPMSFKKNLKSMKLLSVESSGTLQLPDKPLLNVKKYETVAAVLSFQGRDVDGKFCTIENDIGKLGRHILQNSKFFPNTSECFYLIQNQLLLDSEQRKKTENDEEKLIAVNTKETRILKLLKQHSYETRCGFVQMSSEPFYDYVARISDCENASPDIGSKNDLNTAEEAHPTVPALPNSENPSREAVRQLETKGIHPMSVEDAKSNSDFRSDGFHILYNNSRESFDDEEEAIKMVFAKCLAEKNPRNVFPSKNNIFDKEKEVKDERNRKKKDGCFNEEMEIFRSLEKKTSRQLKYKSNSSPIESIYQTEFCYHEHRMKRSLVLSKETEKDFYGSKKRKLPFDKAVETRKTESALLECRIPALVKKRSYPQKNGIKEIKDTFRNLVLPLELKTRFEPEGKSKEKRTTFALEKRMNLRKEIIAAFNSIKELNRCKGEPKGGQKRMSLVIMLSRK